MLFSSPECLEFELLHLSRKLPKHDVLLMYLLSLCTNSSVSRHSNLWSQSFALAAFSESFLVPPKVNCSSLSLPLTKHIPAPWQLAAVESCSTFWTFQLLPAASLLESIVKHFCSIYPVVLHSLNSLLLPCCIFLEDLCSAMMINFLLTQVIIRLYDAVGYLALSRKNYVQNT